MRTAMMAIGMVVALSVTTPGVAQRGGRFNVKREKRAQQLEMAGKDCKTHDGRYIKCPATSSGAAPAAPSANQSLAPANQQQPGDSNEKAPDGE